MKMTMFSSNSVGRSSNCIYPNKVVVESPEDLKTVVSYDHVCAEFRNSYRSIPNFISSDVIVMDCDNDHSEDPDEWIDAAKMDDMLSDVSYAVVYSRSHMKAKNGKSARPRFHVYFPISSIEDAEAYALLKARIQQAFRFFDGNALDAARFIYGTDSAESVWHEGWCGIDEIELPATDDMRQEMDDKVIRVGSRNSTLSRYAAKVLKRFGNGNDKAWNLFCNKASCCEPPLEEGELKQIWRSASSFYDNKVKTMPGYKAPSEYDSDFGKSLKPQDYTDVGQGKVLAVEFGDELIFTRSTDFLRYDGRRWVEDSKFAMCAVVDFTDMQLQEACDAVSVAREKLLSLGVDKDDVVAGGKTLGKKMKGDDQLKAYVELMAAESYHAFVLQRRNIKYLNATMSVASALLNRDINDLDSNPFLLNTPEATYDLRNGKGGMSPHSAQDFITKMTNSEPGDEGMELWQKTLDLFFQGDRELIEYVQLEVGDSAIGKVNEERMIIAYGKGANGKSTFWNTIARVMGSYSGKISAEVLTVGNRHNAKPEMAELKGKRLIIASEMEEGVRLNTAIVKQLCSTDPIQAEKKYRDPFSFTPTHTLVLYTNHLPRVGANDDGIWRRLVVIPFLAKITGGDDIKNFSDYLYEKAGGAILQWIIEGARKAIEKDYRWELPKKVEAAIAEYRDQNDWFAMFLEDCCEVGEGLSVPSGDFYNEYRNWCTRNGEYIRNSTDFYAAVEKAGLQRRRTHKIRTILGVALKSEFLQEK